MAEALWQKWPGGQMSHECTHFFKSRTRGWIAGQIVLLVRVVTQMKQFFASVALPVDVGPLCVFDRAQRRELPGRAIRN